MPKIQDIRYIPGDTLPIDGTVTGVNLTGSTVKFHLRVNEDSETEFMVKTASVTGATTYTLTLTAGETTGLKGAYFYLIKVTDMLGQVTTVTTGIFTDEAPLVFMSYATVEYADTYFDNQLFADTWTAASDTTKEKALKMATRKIDQMFLKGCKADRSQPLEFPRAGESEVTQEVKEATCEEALTIIKGGSLAHNRAEMQRQGITSFGLGPLSETYSGVSTPGKLMSPTAAKLMTRYTSGGWSIV